REPVFQRLPFSFPGVAVHGGVAPCRHQLFPPYIEVGQWKRQANRPTQNGMREWIFMREQIDEWKEQPESCSRVAFEPPTRPKRCGRNQANRRSGHDQCRVEAPNSTEPKQQKKACHEK